MSRSKKTNNAQNKSQNKQTEVGTDAEKTPDTKEKPSCDKQYHKIVIENKEKLRGYKEPVVVATLILSVVTFLLVLATAFLYYGADESLREYQKEFEEVNRPYITLTNFKIDTIGMHPIMDCSFDAVNTGKFPATLKYFSAQSIIGIDTLHYNAIGKVSTHGENEFLPFNGIYNFHDLIVLDNPYKKNIFLGKEAIFLRCDYEYFNSSIAKNYKAHIVYKISFTYNQMNASKVSDNETENKLVK